MPGAQTIREAIIEMSMLAVRHSFEQGALPPFEQLKLHVDAEVLSRLVVRDVMFGSAREFIAKPFPDRGQTLASVVRRVLEADDGLDDSTWLTVTAAADLLRRDLPALNARQASARVSKAATSAKFVTNRKSGTARRIERVSFDAWRLKQRDRDLDAEDVA